MLQPLLPSERPLRPIALAPAAVQPCRGANGGAKAAISPGRHPAWQCPLRRLPQPLSCACPRAPPNPTTPCTHTPAPAAPLIKEVVQRTIKLDFQPPIPKQGQAFVREQLDMPVSQGCSQRQACLAGGRSS